MLGDISVVDSVYIVRDTTNVRRFIDGLCYIIRDKLSMNPDQLSLFLFCWKRCDQIEILLHEPAGYVLLYKRLSVTQGRYHWPQKSSEIQAITWHQLDWILDNPKQSRPIKKIHHEIAEIFRRHFGWMCG